MELIPILKVVISIGTVATLALCFYVYVWRKRRG